MAALPILASTWAAGPQKGVPSYLVVDKIQTRQAHDQRRLAGSAVGQSGTGSWSCKSGSDSGSRCGHAARGGEDACAAAAGRNCRTNRLKRERHLQAAPPRTPVPRRGGVVAGKPAVSTLRLGKTVAGRPAVCMLRLSKTVVAVAGRTQSVKPAVCMLSLGKTVAAQSQGVCVTLLLLLVVSRDLRKMSRTARWPAKGQDTVRAAPLK
mmetsp:Transcript_19605/g.58127  ORF Transcript_19605/g.58127 Transcript_19605/m.58127 type:complete len:208 (-) Transcript_19605:1457-2080(-)